MRSPRTEELWRRFGAGDGSAFSQLYSDHHQDVVRYCRSLLRDDEDAQDAAQGAWAAVWNKPDAARRDVPLRPWLFRIAHNESISIIRRRRPHEPLGDLDVPARDDVEGDAELRDRLATLRDDLVRLPERQRVALLSRELAGLDHAQIADALGISAPAAKQAIYEARRALVEAETGRTMACDVVQRAISDGDGRVRRSRRLNAHLRGCAGCATFADAVARRRRELRLLFPAPAALGLLASAGAGAGVGAGVGGGAAVVGGSMATKLAVTAAVVAVAGVGAQRELADPKGADAKGPAVTATTRSVAAAAAPKPTTAPARRAVVSAVARTTAPPAGARPSTAAPAPRPGNAARQRPSTLTPRPAPVEVPTGAPARRAAAAATKAKARTPLGQAKNAEGHAPPGRAKTADGAQPPGQAKKGAPAAAPPAASTSDDAPGHGKPDTPPGQAKKP